MFFFSESNPYYYPLSNYQESNITTFSQQNHDQNLFQGLNSSPPIPVTPPNYMGCPSNMNTNLTSNIGGGVKKKNKHTKITTSQGVRDRRVRLSISIAREFFNLQDMLGFDKASKTLDWLMGKSKTAIDELATIDRNTNVDQQNEKQVINLSGKTILLKKKREKSSLSICKIDPIIRDVRREKARERARERTRNKMMMMSNLNRQMGNLHDQHNQRAQNNSMICKSSFVAPSKGISVGESVVVKSKMMMRSNDYQEISCNYYNDYHLTRF